MALIVVDNNDTVNQFKDKTNSLSSAIGDLAALTIPGTMVNAINEIDSAYQDVKTLLDGSNAGTLDGESASYYLDWNNFTNIPPSFDSELAGATTSDLDEGINLYYTVARANSAIDARVTKTFVDALNTNADTLDNEQGSYYLNYNNFTNTPDIDSDIDARVTKTFVDALNINADTLDGQHGSYYQNYNNLTNKPTPYSHPNHSGDVTSVGDGAQTIANNVVTNAKMATMVQATLKGRASGAGTGNVTDLTAAQVRTILNVENGATADQSNAEIETAYNAQVSTVSQGEAEAGTSTTVRRWTAQRVKQAIAALETRTYLVTDPTVRTSAVNPAAVGKRYICNTSGGAFAITLPASATIGDRIGFVDYLDTWPTNNLTISRNGHKIRNVPDDLILDVSVSIELEYVNATVGWLMV